MIFSSTCHRSLELPVCITEGKHSIQNLVDTKSINSQHLNFFIVLSRRKYLRRDIFECFRQLDCSVKTMLVGEFYWVIWDKVEYSLWRGVLITEQRCSPCFRLIWKQSCLYAAVCLGGCGKGEMNCENVCETCMISVDCGGTALLLSLVTFPGFVRGHLCWSLAHIDITQKTDL